MATLLITPDEIKTKTPITKNVDESKFCHWIEVVQETYLEKVIRKSCLSDLKTAFAADTLSANQTTLLDDYIKPFLAWRVYQYSVTDFASTVTKVGIETKSEADNEPASDTRVSWKRKDGENAADEYQERLICYLCDNTDLFPCYLDCDDCDQPINKTNKGGFAFRQKNRSARDEFDRYNRTL